jgi:hypothetical protein
MSASINEELIEGLFKWLETAVSNRIVFKKQSHGIYRRIRLLGKKNNLFVEPTYVLPGKVKKNDPAPKTFAELVRERFADDVTTYSESLEGKTDEN